MHNRDKTDELGAVFTLEEVTVVSETPQTARIEALWFTCGHEPGSGYYDVFERTAFVLVQGGRRVAPALRKGSRLRVTPDERRGPCTAYACVTAAIDLALFILYQPAEPQQSLRRELRALPTRQVLLGVATAVFAADAFPGSRGVDLEPGEGPRSTASDRPSS
ncbi:hypothetical protein [Actinacidiphila glaucinigra]|uniref:hypothetical protein n=1 Tax=Actinacidiphila glaucinigra TaxID=235986 RepID=UPI00117CE989|nr:hypothetical protein [Actinacidiphila glaucinigra]